MQEIEVTHLKTIEDVYNLVKNHFLDKKSKLKESNEEFKILIKDLDLETINLASLTMLTCLLYSIRKHYSFPFKGFLQSQKEEEYFASKLKSSYLKAVGFFDLTQELRIIQWYLPMQIPNENFNPNTGIRQLDIFKLSTEAQRYFNLSDKDPYDKDLFLLNIIRDENPKMNEEDVLIVYEDTKTKIKNEIKDVLENPAEELFKKSKQARTLKHNIISYVSEILLNSFIHGRTKPFLAMQRTNKRILVSISDDGVGLEKSFKVLHKTQLTEKEAIIRACEHRRNNSYGLFDVVRSVIGLDKPSFIESDGHHGYFTISNGANILKITRNNYKEFESGEINNFIYDTKLSIRGVRIVLDILIK